MPYSGRSTPGNVPTPVIEEAGHAPGLVFIKLLKLINVNTVLFFPYFYFMDRGIGLSNWIYVVFMVLL
jgi:hypothetical protein